MGTNLLQLILKPEVLEKYKTTEQLAGINLDQKENLLLLNKIELEFGAHGLLRQLKKEGTLLPLINKHKKAQRFVVTSCRRFL